MPKIEWDSSCATGISFIDKQHQTLFAMMGAFHDAVASGKSRGEIVGVFDQLIEHTKAHFKEEEQMLETNGYEGLAAHKEIHAQLMNAVARLKDDFVSRVDGPAESASQFFRHWLKKHILETDMKYSAPMKAKGVT